MDRHNNPAEIADRRNVCRRGTVAADGASIWPARVRVGATGVRDHSWKPLTTSSRPDACTDSCTRCRLRPPHVSLIDRRETDHDLFCRSATEPSSLADYGGICDRAWITSLPLSFSFRHSSLSFYPTKRTVRGKTTERTDMVVLHNPLRLLI